jgi:hypothetical protein
MTTRARFGAPDEAVVELPTVIAHKNLHAKDGAGLWALMSTRRESRGTWSGGMVIL